MTDDRPETKPCPICGEVAAAGFGPFCSDRCRMRDLAHWVGGDEPYVIPGAPVAFAGMDPGGADEALPEEAAIEDGPGAGAAIRADFRARGRPTEGEARPSAGGAGQRGSNCLDRRASRRPGSSVGRAAD